MTTTPVLPVFVPEPLTAKLKADYSWLTHHILLLLVTGALVIGGIYFTESIIAKHDLAAEQRADAKLSAFVSTTNAHEAELAQTQAQLLTMISQLQAQNAQLQNSISARNIQTQKQVQTDATLSAQDAAQRLTAQTKAGATEIVAAGNSVTMDLPISRAVVADLDLLAAAQTNLVDTQTQLTNEDTLFNKSQDANSQQAIVISNLQAQNTEQVKACAAEVTTVKAQARKSKIKWFFIGYVAGWVSGKIVKIGT